MKDVRVSVVLEDMVLSCMWKELVYGEFLTISLADSGSNRFTSCI
jgi:hypothetical protein